MITIGRTFNVIAALAIHVSLIGVSYAQAERNTSNHEPVAGEVQLTGCTKTWQQLWPPAKTGDPEAQMKLGLGIIVAGIVPPGVQVDDQKARIERALTLLIYGSRSGNEYGISVAKTVIANFSPKDTQADLVECVDTSKKNPQCIDRLVMQGAIERFSTYVKRTDSADARRVICLPRPM